MPHIMTPPLAGVLALAVEPVVCPPHIWADAGALEASARTVAVRAREMRMIIFSAVVMKRNSLGFRTGLTILRTNQSGALIGLAVSS
jgi:ABC-type Na+ efflux pump permease subunit